MIQKYLVLLVAVSSMVLAGCHKQQQTQRNDPYQDYERFINSHVFAACENVGTPYARYSLASIIQRPQRENSPYYKIRFVNGPCEGWTGWTQEIIRQTSPLENASFLPEGTVVIRNFDNPKDPFDKDVTGHWNLAVVMGTQRADKGIIDLGFPRDKNDFFPARESIYVHNIRTIQAPAVKDIRQFIKQ